MFSSVIGCVLLACAVGVSSLSVDLQQKQQEVIKEPNKIIDFSYTVEKTTLVDIIGGVDNEAWVPFNYLNGADLSVSYRYYSCYFYNLNMENDGFSITPIVYYQTYEFKPALASRVVRRSVYDFNSGAFSSTGTVNFKPYLEFGGPDGDMIFTCTPYTYGNDFSLYTNFYNTCISGIAGLPSSYEDTFLSYVDNSTFCLVFTNFDNHFAAGYYMNFVNGMNHTFANSYFGFDFYGSIFQPSITSTNIATDEEFTFNPTYDGGNFSGSYPIYFSNFINSVGSNVYNTYCSYYLTSADSYGGIADDIYLSPTVVLNRDVVTLSSLGITGKYRHHLQNVIPSLQNRTYGSVGMFSWGHKLDDIVSISRYFTFTFIPVDTTYSSAYNDGYFSGHTDGYNQGYEVGYTDGNSTGYASGYDNGYRTGLNENTNTSFLGLFGAVADTPILMLRSLFDFDLFGINVLSVMLSLITAMFVMFVIRKFI